MDIILKHSDQLNLVPDVDELEYGELAVNYAKGSEGLFLRNNQDEVVSIPLATPVEPNEIKEFIKIIDGTPSTSEDGGIFYNEDTHRLEKWEHETDETMMLVESYNIELNDILYCTSSNDFYIFDGTNLNEIAINIGLATSNKAGLVKGGGNVDINRINGMLSVDLSDYATTASVNTAISDNNNALDKDSILHYYRLDWLDSTIDNLTMVRYNSALSVLSYYNEIPKLLMKGGKSVSQWAIDGDAMIFDFIEMNGDDVLKIRYTVTPGPDATTDLHGEYLDTGHCVVTKEVSVDNNRILNYDGLDLTTTGGSYGTITNEVNGNNGLFEFYELLPNIENIVRRSELIYFGYYSYITVNNLPTTFTEYNQRVDIEVDNSKVNPVLSVICSKHRKNVKCDVNGDMNQDNDDVIKIYKVSGQSKTEIYSTNGIKATLNVRNYMNSGSGTTTFSVEYITTARKFGDGDFENWLTYGISEINLISSVTENAGGSPSFTHEDYIPLTKPTLTLQYVGSDTIKHVVTYTSFYCTTETDSNDKSYAICVAEGVSSIFAWIFSDVKTNGWKFAIGSDYTTVKNTLLTI